MTETIRLRVLTEAGVALDEEAVSVVAHGELGYLGILRNHAPLVTTLSSGKLTYRAPSAQTKVLRLGAGLLEVEHNRLTILTESVSQPETSPSSAT